MSILCHATGKESHRVQGKARSHLRGLRVRKGYVGGHVYRCRHCGGWHVGRPKARAR